MDRIESAKPGATPPPPKRPVGRPRRLSLEDIVDAACQLGLDKIEMGVLAERLNIGAGTLYSYVRSREELLHLVGERLAQRYRVEDIGQDWQQLLRDHGEMSAAVFAQMPHLLGDMLAARHVSKEQEYGTRFVGLLVARGFAHDHAVTVFVEVTQIIIGAAMGAQRRKVLEATVPNDARSPGIPSIVGDHRPTLERLIRDVEAQLGKPKGRRPAR